MYDFSNCTLCPRNCGADRINSVGFCNSGDKVKVARAALHFWEEPCISGKNGSGAVFFSGCNLRCCFCQNYNISSENFGKEISVGRLAEIFCEWQDKNANNINLVTPTQFVPQIIEALDMVREKIKLPIIYNSSGYEKTETIKMLKNHIDVFLPDLKYFSSDLAKKYSNAENYFEYASKAIKEMYDQTGDVVFGDDGLIKKGVIIRHLVLPDSYKDSIRIVEWIHTTFGENKVLLSLMNQYTPINKTEHKCLNRRLTTLEYKKVLNKVLDYNIQGFMQERSSQKAVYTPDFDLHGV